MAYPTKKCVGETGFHGITFKATPSELIGWFPYSYRNNNDGRGKSNFRFKLETESGKVFIVYDWKEYRPLDMGEIVEWRIGSDSVITSRQAKKEVQKLLNTTRK